MTRRLLPLVALLAVVALGAAACGGSEEPTTTAVTTEPPATTTTPAPPPPPPPVETKPKPKPESRRVTIVVRDGKVVGGLARATFAKGEKVVLVVRSDIADEVHLHGYDVSKNVAPGTPARLAFVASLPGRFEVELEERGLPIADLTVRP
jgi:hypothetical protein